MRMIRTSLLVILAAALVPGAALADDDRDGDRDRDKRKGEGKPPVALVGPQIPAETVYIVKGNITALSSPLITITVNVTKANDAGATALGLPKPPPVSQVVLLGPDTKVLRSSRGWKHDDSKGRDRKGGGTISTDPASLLVGDEVKVKWVGAPGLLGATTLATTAARQIIAKGAPAPPLVKFKVKALVMSVPAPGAVLPVTILVDPYKVNLNAAQALNPGNTTITGGSYNLAGTIPVIIDASTKVKVRGRGHGDHHRSGKGKWKLYRVKVGDRVEVEWKAPALSKFWEKAAHEVEFKALKHGWQIVG